MFSFITIFFFVLLLCFLDSAFIVLVIPKLVQLTDKILRGELFLSVFEFFFAGFSLLLFTVLILFLLVKLLN